MILHKKALRELKKEDKNAYFHHKQPNRRVEKSIHTYLFPKRILVTIHSTVSIVERRGWGKKRKKEKGEKEEEERKKRKKGKRKKERKENMPAQ